MPKEKQFVVEEVDGTDAFRRRLNNGAPIGYRLHSWNVFWGSGGVTYTLVYELEPTRERVVWDGRLPVVKTEQITLQQGKSKVTDSRPTRALIDEIDV